MSRGVQVRAELLTFHNTVTLLLRKGSGGLAWDPGVDFVESGEGVDGVVPFVRIVER